MWVRLPKGMPEEKYPEKVNGVNDMRIRFIMWAANPFTYNTSLSESIESPIIEFALMDELTTYTYPLTLSTAEDRFFEIQVTAQYLAVKHLDPQYLKCKV